MCIKVLYVDIYYCIQIDELSVRPDNIYLDPAIQFPICNNEELDIVYKHLNIIEDCG